MSLLQIIITVLIPPVGVLLAKGLGKDFLINLILTMIFYVPGLIHGLYIQGAGQAHA